MENRKTINVLLPKGFKLVIEESFQSGFDKIFVFVNEQDKRLYMKLASLEDIRRGIIWEVLSPNELKSMSIEESYNEEVYEKEVYTVEESASEDEQEKIRQEAKKFMEEQKRKNTEKSGVTINLVSKEGSKEKGIESEFGQNMLLRLQHECADLGVDYVKPKTVEDINALVSAVQTARKAQAERHVEPVGHGGSGQVSLSQQSGSGSRSYDTVDEMIDDLRRQASRENEEGENAKAILDEFWRKSLSGQKELKRGSGEMQYVGKKKASGKEEGMNEERAREFRKRRKQRREDENEK